MTIQEVATIPPSTEHRRMAERDAKLKAWDLWGSYLSDRQWGTVREDYSADGDAWASFPHDHARSRTCLFYTTDAHQQYRVVYSV